MFTIRVVVDGVARLSGRLDADEAPEALTHLQSLPGPLTLECSDLEYISSAGLGVVVQIYKRLNAAGQELRIVNLRPNVRNVFTYAGLHRLLQIE
jgi:anti-sigma B factor antagonist